MTISLQNSHLLQFQLWSKKTCCLQLGLDQVATARADAKVHQVWDDTLVTHQQLTNPAASAPTAAAGPASSVPTPAAAPSDTTAAAVLPASATAAASPLQGSPANATVAAPLQGTNATVTPEPSGLAVTSSPQSAPSSSSAADFPPGRLSVQREAPWNLRKLQQGHSPSDTTFAYTNHGTGVHVYMLDTVGHLSCARNNAGLSRCDLSAFFPCSHSSSHQQPTHQTTTRQHYIRLHTQAGMLCCLDVFQSLITR